MRKKISWIIFASIILMVFYIGFYPFIFKSDDFKDFCYALESQENNYQKIKEYAKQKGFSAFDKGNEIIIHNPKNFGRETCIIIYNINDKNIKYNFSP